MKYAAMALVFKNGKILSVSRKNDHSDMGLPGGKLDPGETFEAAAIRETEEETGLRVKVICHVFDRVDDGFLGKTFFCVLEDSGAEFVINESGRVDWVDWYDVFNGSFGEYNRNLYSHLLKFSTMNPTLDEQFQSTI